MIAPAEDGCFDLTADGHRTLELLTRTGEERLSALLEAWRPEEHEELARAIAQIARAFFVDTSALTERITATSAA